MRCRELQLDPVTSLDVVMILLLARLLPLRAGINGFAAPPAARHGEPPPPRRVRGRVPPEVMTRLRRVSRRKCSTAARVSS